MRITEAPDYPYDMVVAVELATGKAIAAWPGERYRRYDAERVHQVQVSFAASSEAAIERAERIIGNLALAAAERQARPPVASPGEHLAAAFSQAFAADPDLSPADRDELSALIRTQLGL
jgi:hypothetical protein